MQCLAIYIFGYCVIKNSTKLREFWNAKSSEWIFFQLCDLSETVIRHITEEYNLAEMARILKPTQILSSEWRLLFCCNIIYYLLTYLAWTILVNNGRLSDSDWRLTFTKNFPLTLVNKPKKRRKQEDNRHNHYKFSHKLQTEP